MGSKYGAVRGLLAALGAMMPVARSGAESMPTRWTCGTTVPCVVAHRSWRHPSQPENSLGEMKKTRAQGVHMLEMDLAASRDGTLYLMHDETVDRTTDGHGAIDTMHDSEIDRLHLKTGSGKQTTDSVPRLHDVLAWATATPDTFLMLDIKRAPPALVGPLVRRLGMIDKVLVLTFDTATARSVLAADPDWRVSVLVRSNEDLLTYRNVANGRPVVAYIPTFASPGLFHIVRAAGVSIVTDAIMPFPGGSLDSRAEAGGAAVYRRYFEKRPMDVLVTNHADRVIKTLSSAAGGK